MGQRKRIGLLPNQRAELLASLREARRAAVRVRTEFRIGGPEYEAAGEAMRSLDKLAGLLRSGEAERDSRGRTHATW